MQKDNTISLMKQRMWVLHRSPLKRISSSKLQGSQFSQTQDAHTHYDLHDLH